MFTEMTFTSTDEERRTMYTASVERHEAVPRTPAARGGLATKSIRPSGWRARPLASPLSTGRGLASSGRGSLVTDQQWLEFFATQGLSCFVGKENFLPLFFEERRVTGEEVVYERGSLLHDRRIALVIAGELARASLPAGEGRPRP